MVHSIMVTDSVINNPHPIYNNSGEPRALRYFFYANYLADSFLLCIFAS